jgi:hypothetical protein
MASGLLSNAGHFTLSVDMSAYDSLFVACNTLQLAHTIGQQQITMETHS